jgi:hypothetical protein
MPLNILSCSILVCEKILVEVDNITSAIRIVDVFYVPHPAPEIPLISISALLTLRVNGYDSSEHLLDVRLIGPTGQDVAAISGQKVTMSPKIGEADIGGFTAGTVLNIAIKQPGLFYVVAFLDGEEIARTPFTVRQQSDQTDQA